MEKTYFAPGCYIAGHTGWRAIGELVEIAVDHGMQLNAKDEAQLISFFNDGDFLEEVVDMSDDALDYMNSITQEGFSWIWQDGELFVWSDEDIEEMDGEL